MDTLVEIWNYPLLENSFITIKVGGILSLVFIALGAWIGILLAKRWVLRKLATRTPRAQKSRQALFSFVRYLILLTAVATALFSLGIDLNRSLFRVNKFDLTLSSLLQIAVILMVARLSIELVQRFVLAGKVSTDRLDEGRRYAVFQIFKYLTYVLAILLSLSSVGLDINVLIASSAALLVGLGFGMQGIFNDVISGIVILFEGTIEVNDIVDVGGLVGRVKEIRLRTTEIETKDSVGIIVPNSKFTGDNVINWSHTATETRIRVSVGVSYDSDVQTVKRVMIECAQNHGDILKYPKPTVFFQEFADSSLNFDLVFWIIKNFETERIQSDIRYAIFAAFKKQNIQIPFPQRDLHFISDTRKPSAPTPDFPSQES
ncbi:MAG: mechanosensitive ion channel domain-containing protein [Bacteroidota bacterium]